MTNKDCILSSKKIGDLEVSVHPDGWVSLENTATSVPFLISPQEISPLIDYICNEFERLKENNKKT